MSQLPKIWAIVPAAGIGRRMGAEIPKQYLEIGGRTVLEITLGKLALLPLAGMCVAVAENDTWFAGLTHMPAMVQRVAGGDERAHSVLNALNWLTEQGAIDDWALVHDAARPCVHPRSLEQLLAETAYKNRGGLLAARVADTLKKSHADGRVSTLDRHNLWQAHTPQVFPIQTLQHALRQALADGAVVTDEASAVERLGLSPWLVEDSRANIKITQPEDLALAEFILQHQSQNAEK